MHFSKVSISRSICINGDWDNTLYEMTLQEGESLTKAEEAIEQKLIEWETKVRTQRNPTEQSFTKATDIAKKDKSKEQEEAALIGEIFSCKDLDTLKTYEVASNSANVSKAVTETYNMMFKKLNK